MHICPKPDKGDKMGLISRNANKDLILLTPGQKVRVVRTVSIAVTVDIREYLDGDPQIWANELEMDIEDNWDIPTMLDQCDDAEITDISVEVTEIL